MFAQKGKEDTSKNNMVHFDGHEVAILGSVSGFYGITRGIYGKGWIKSMIQRQPVVAMSVALATVGVAMPVFIPPHPKEIGPAHQPV